VKTDPAVMTEAGDGRLRRFALSPWTWLAFILAVALGLRLQMFGGIIRLDMFRYMEVSYHVLHGGSLFDQNVFYASSRLTLLAPLLLFNWLFGYGEHVSTLWPLMCSIGIVAVAFLIGRELFDDRVGLVAAALAAFAPIEIELATQLLPDAVEGFFVGLAIYLGIRAVKRDRGWRAAAALSGAALALAYFTRVNAVLFMPGLLALGLLLDPSKWRRSLWALAGFAGILGAAAVVFWALSGDPLVDWHKTQAFYAAYRTTGFIVRKHPFWYLIAREVALTWLWPTLAFGAAVAAVRTFRPRRGSGAGQAEEGHIGMSGPPARRAEAMLVIWALGFYFYLDVVSAYQGLDASYRYAEPMVLPALVLAAAGVVWLWRALPGAARALPVVGLAVALLLMARSAGIDTSRYARNIRWAAIRSAAKVVAKPGEDRPVYVDDPWVFVSLDYYSRYRLGRDTLAPVGAPVNRGSRLSSLSEVPSPARPFLLVSTLPKKVRDLPALRDARMAEIASFRYTTRERLKVLLVTKSGP
jgi:hypothetical protein